MDLIDSIIALEKAKEACKPENIEKRAAEKVAELFPSEWVEKTVADFMEKISPELETMRKEVL